MITRGDVQSIRELSGSRVQARVCLGSDPRLGSVVMSYEARSPEVLEALQNLKLAISHEALGLTANILEEHRKWEAEVEEAKRVRAEQEKREARNAARRAKRS